VLKKDKEFSYQEVREILCFYYGNSYYLGNLIFAICLYTNYNNILNHLGLDFLLCIIAFVFYFRVYSSYVKKNQIHSFKSSGFLNHIAFNVNICFILAWNVCYMTIITASFLALIIKSKNFIYYSNLGFQIFLTIFSIIAMSHYSDVYFCFIIVIFQIGNTLNKHLFNFNANDQEYIDKHNFHLLLALFTLICLLGSVIKKQRQILEVKGEDKGLKDVNEIKRYYESQDLKYENGL